MIHILSAEHVIENYPTLILFKNGIRLKHQLDSKDYHNFELYLQNHLKHDEL